MNYYRNGLVATSCPVGLLSPRPASQKQWWRDGMAVGASLLQTPGGVQSELSRINDDFLAFSTELTEYLYSHGYPTHTEDSVQPLVALFSGVWTPLIQNWQSFYARNSGWLDNLWWNHAPEAEEFLRQLHQVRGQAGALGMDVRSPEPYKPWGGIVPEVAAPFWRELWKLLRFALVAGACILGGYLVLRTALPAILPHGGV